MTKVLLALSAATLAFTSAQAFAGCDEHKKKMSLEEKFAKMDANKDGVVTQAEFTAMGERYTAEAFTKVAGDDAQLTLDELKAHYKAKKKDKKK